MRFDDRLNTVLKGELPEGLAAAVQWRQVIDIMAQKPGILVNEDVQAGLTRLRDLHERVNEGDRVSAVNALAGRLRSAPLLVYLCADNDPISDAAITAADLPDEEWVDLIPQLPERGRFSLSQRSDLGPRTKEMLGIDVGLTQTEPQSAPEPQVQTGNSDTGQSTTDSIESDIGIDDNVLSGSIEQQETSQISALVERIADYQRNRAGETPQLPLGDGDKEHRSYFVENIDRINFETDDRGTIIWIEGPPKGSVVGVSIAEPTFDDGPGPDAYGAAAFRQRMPLENARMRLCGAAVVAGDWRMTAIPYFVEETGRFKGYRGIMRRPNAAEDAGQSGLDVQRREQLQQLIHELRTPLNAIIGFSEIIEQQLFGPASFEYRTLSRSIMDEARRLLSGFEDLDVAAKVDAGQMEAIPGFTDPDWLFDRLSQRLQSLTQSKAVDLHIRKAEPVRSFALDGESVERIFARLLSAAIIACDIEEELVAELRTRIGPQPVNYFSLSRPSRIKGISEEQLLDPSQGIDGDASDAPLLGLGFSLRLVRNLARSASGSLTITEDRIGLTLPAAATSELVVRETERD
ncbi:sensor histidine kinase [Parasphingorhabdus halotolerans]|uniref:histidine kinase n=1 Tax=Parasphingorhabdus halotolerans TaxID=2725558 RepID=A0A6H2DJN9_9SPHN|nr:HAMP domain-containing sensor histidine kinase [Parasphingorhabdus halotolerans]QJB68203.1 HAMP domain-containing histidine kinase [Parasphingorhabdus halotolerans]